MIGSSGRGAPVGGEPGPAAVQVTMCPSRAIKHEAGREGSQLRFGESLMRREGCRAPGRWACGAPVEHRVEGLDVGPGRRACQDLRGVKLGRAPGGPVQGPSPGRFDYWHLRGRPTGCCKRRGCMLSCAESAGGPAGAGTGLVGWSRVARTGRFARANRPSLGQPSA